MKGNWPDGEYRLWDSQWMNIVNDPKVLDAEQQSDAVALAVELTEKAMAKNLRGKSVSEGVAHELLTNIQRACIRGRNSLPTIKEHSNSLATFDHIEDLARQAKTALGPEVLY